MSGKETVSAPACPEINFLETYQPPNEKNKHPTHKKQAHPIQMRHHPAAKHLKHEINDTDAWHPLTTAHPNQRRGPSDVEERRRDGLLRPTHVLRRLPVQHTAQHTKKSVHGGVQQIPHPVHTQPELGLHERERRLHSRTLTVLPLARALACPCRP